MKRKSILVAPVLAILLNTSLNAEQFSISNLSLKQAIEEISKKSNMPYMVDGKLLDGKKAPNIKNVEGVENALNEILKDTNLKATIEDGTILIKEKVIGQGTVLEPISVNSGKSGTAEDGYLVDDVKTLGVWGNLSLQDTPYSMSIMSSDFIENTITSNMNQVAKVNPVMTNKENASQNGEISSAVRGFGVNQALIDGIPLPFSFFGTSTNEVDRIEVISGLSGFLYGGGNVGGTINYALKYPKATPITKISVGNNGGQNYYTSVDTSQNITDKLSVRVFGNYQGGDTAIENYEDEEKLIGISFAYKPTDNLDLGLYYAHRESTTGTKPMWIITGKMPNAKDFDTSKSYAPDWANVDVDSDKVELKANYNFSEDLRLRTAYIYKDATRIRPYLYNLVDTNTNSFQRGLYWFYKQQTKNEGAYAYLDGDFNTGSIHHALTFGGSFGTEKFYSRDFHDTWGDPLGSTNFSDYNNWNYTIPSGTVKKGLAREQFKSNIVLGDNITFNEQWSALIGANLANVQQDTWNTNTKAKTGSYDKDALTPTISIIYKPIEDLTTYVTYIESLENGSVIDNPADTKDGQVFDPLTSKQYEIGAKWSIKEDLLLSTALFRIEKANNMTEKFADNGNGKTQTTTQDGEQINQGVEVLVTGKPTDSLTLMGGVTYLSPKVEKTTNKALEGKESTEVARVQAKMYAEYRLPIEPKIYLNGGVYYTGTQWVDDANTQKLDAYTTVDFGARYETKLDGYDTTFRIYASNITDEKYWADTTTLSDPRSVAFNVTLKF
ncbi:TonB-dependent siderophore receptor [Aliarcobacter butzleri]|uniref:TonB-dependent siderophore receptor n=1 Tax=Aliarcobacter butzleri TaxID=28197 RepID=A0AAW7PQX3_9BACT|nr:TonB-dependent siderophore receptor [Aliarcobacter butzleri]MDN5063602.1 TonB-dependent siderophore receptor [Aliarcobacter butzleri]MDN5067104.1 TonB-dependent siderophore receptor [Aliarcobacter butzleri]